MSDKVERATYSVQEAGELLGISRGSAYEAARSGEIPTLRFGSRLVVPKAPLDQMVGKERKTEPSDA